MLQTVKDAGVSGLVLFAGTYSDFWKMYSGIQRMDGGLQ